ncbi:MarR family winged helix-turn-helix transcriptional regulator [Leifsonia poae]|uniref:MarR family winged helix-turn-helix transcriptional regulator n=1 Tax=Leifsonia poae TaxID=110933 RepID=UPI0027DEB11A|nr:MarR family transcriptional regulator [Leifsonia poae]
MLDPRVIDPHQELVDYSAMDEAEIAQITRVLIGIRRWRETEQAISFQSRNHMRLNETDMKALRFLVVSKNQNLVVTPGALADHLNISTASTTKLLDRLAAAGHIQRSPHPTDRRALMITITKDTHEHVRDTVGRTHARRFDVAARLSPDEREVVIRFLGSSAKPGTRRVPMLECDANQLQRLGRSHDASGPSIAVNRGCGSGIRTASHSVATSGLRCSSLAIRCNHSYCNCPTVTGMSSAMWSDGPIFARSK